MGIHHQIIGGLSAVKNELPILFDGIMEAFRDFVIGVRLGAADASGKAEFDSGEGLSLADWAKASPNAARRMEQHLSAYSDMLRVVPCEPGLGQSPASHNLSEQKETPYETDQLESPQPLRGIGAVRERLRAANPGVFKRGPAGVHYPK